MSAVAWLITELQAALPTYRVVGYLSALDAVPRPTVSVWVDTFTRPQIGDRTLIYMDTRVQVIVGPEDPEAADDDLWTATAEVLAALDPMQRIEWSQIERGVRNDSFHVHTITAQTIARIGE